MVNTAMMGMALQVYADSTLSQMVADWSHRLASLSISTGEHGDEALEASVILPPPMAWRFYDNLLVFYVALSDNAGPVWQGRLEDVALESGGLRIKALGGWRALYDAPYSAFWSDARYENWIVATDDDIAARTPEKYQTDTNNRLYATTLAGETFATSSDVAQFLFWVPHLSRNDAAAISFDYDFDCPTDWAFRTRVYNDDLSSTSLEDTVTSAGSPLAGSKNLTLTTGYVVVSILLFNNTGGNSTPAGDTGTNYLKITNVRVKGTASATVLADEVVDDIATFINGVNSAQLSAGTGRIQSPGVDLPVAVFEDETPAAVVNALAAIGDNSTPPQRYEAGVEDGTVLYFRPIGERALSWATSGAGLVLDVERTVEPLVNSAYGVYEDARGRIRRTSTATTDSSTDLYNLTRRAAVGVDTTSATVAEAARDAALEDAEIARPRASVMVRRILGPSGEPVPLHWLRAGDELLLRDLPPTAGEAIDRVRQFRTKRTKLNVLAGLLEITPELEPPSLAAQVAGV